MSIAKCTCVVVGEVVSLRVRLILRRTDAALCPDLLYYLLPAYCAAVLLICISHSRLSLRRIDYNLVELYPDPPGFKPWK